MSFYWWRLLTKIRDELKQTLEVTLVWSSSLHTINLHGKWFQNTSLSPPSHFGQPHLG